MPNTTSTLAKQYVCGKWKEWEDSLSLSNLPTWDEGNNIGIFTLSSYGFLSPYYKYGINSFPASFEVIWGNIASPIIAPTSTAIASGGHSIISCKAEMLKTEFPVVVCEIGPPSPVCIREHRLLLEIEVVKWRHKTIAIQRITPTIRWVDENKHLIGI